MPIAGLIRNATCDGEIGESGYYYFTQDDSLREEDPPCAFPFAPRALRLGFDHDHADESDYTECSITYAQVAAPSHTVACIMYGGASLLLGSLLLSWTLRAPAKLLLVHKKRGVLPREIYLCMSLGLLFNAISCIDLKAWANRYPPIVEQLLYEVATGFLHCALFIFVTVKFRAIVNMPLIGGPQKYLTEAHVNGFLWFACITAFATGIITGILQWTLRSRGAHDGTANALKHLILGSLDLIYALACGYRVSVIARHMKGIKSQDLTTEHRRVVRIFLVITVLIIIYGVYNVQKVANSYGATLYRQIPCKHWKALFYESQLLVIVASLLFIIVAWPRTGAISCIKIEPPSAFRKASVYPPAAIATSPMQHQKQEQDSNTLISNFVNEDQM